MFAITPLTVVHIYPFARRLKKVNVINVTQEDYIDSTVIVTEIKEKNIKKELIQKNTLVFTSIGISIVFFIIHVISIAKFIQYGDKVLNRKAYHNIIPIVHGVLSLSAILTGLVLSQIMLYCNYSKITKDGNGDIDVSHLQRKDDYKALRFPIAVISLNIIYVGCYFLPYMLLAFIHNPLLTAFTYLMDALLILFIYLVCLGFWHLYNFKKHKTYDKDIKCAKFLSHLLYFGMTWTAAFAIIMFLFAITYIISLGSFNDFEELKSLAPSLMLAVVGAVLLKPVCGAMLEKFKGDSTKHKEEESGKRNDVKTQRDNKPTGDRDPLIPAEETIQIED